MLAVGGRYLSLATFPVDNHLRLTKKRPIGELRPTTVRAYTRRLGELRSARAVAGVVVRTVRRQSNRIATKLRSKMLLLLVRTLSQARATGSVAAS